MSTLLDHLPKGVRRFLRFIAGLLLLGFIVSILVVLIGWISAYAQTTNQIPEYSDSLLITEDWHISHYSVKMKANVKFNPLACDDDPHTGNYHTTLGLYNGNEDMMLADFGFSRETFELYCKTLR